MKNQLRAGVYLSYLNLAISCLIPFFYTPIMLDMLGQAEYGLYSLAHSVVSYLSLLSLKDKLIKATTLEEIAADLSLEDSISNIVNKICELGAEDITDLNYTPLALAKKFNAEEQSLKAKVAGYVTEYYPYIRSLFQNMEGKNGFHLDVISMQIRCCFIKMTDITEDKEVIFDNMVHWLQTKTQSFSTSACEAVISFFVQNCEVFNEIAE